MASTTLFDINTLPAYIQKEVNEHMEWVRQSHAEHQSRYFANHGFASSSEYREHLLSEFKHDVDAVKSAIQGVLIERYKRHGRRIEQWMKPIINEYPQMLADSVIF